MPGIFDNIFSGGGLFGGAPAPKPQYDWMPPQQPISNSGLSLMGLGLGLASSPNVGEGLNRGLQGMMAGANNDILQQQRLDVLQQHREQVAAAAAMIDKQGGMAPELKRFFAANPKAWEEFSKSFINPNTQIAPSGDVIQTGPFGKVSRPGAVPISEPGKVYDPATQREVPTFNIKPNLGNPQGGIVMPQVAGPQAAPARGGVSSSPKWWGDQEAQNAGLYDKPGVFSGPSEREKAEGAGLGKTFTDQYKTILDKGAAAGKALTTLQRMSQLSDKAYEGAAAPAFQTVRSALATFGLDPGKVPSGEEFTALSNKLVLDAQNGSLGTGVSNADVMFIANINPNMSHTVAGRKEIIATSTALAKRDQEIAKMAGEWRRTNGTMDGFDAALAAWAEKNPLFKGRENTADFGGRFGAAGGGWQDIGGGIRIREKK